MLQENVLGCVLDCQTPDNVESVPKWSEELRILPNLCFRWEMSVQESKVPPVWACNVAISTSSWDMAHGRDILATKENDEKG